MEVVALFPINLLITYSHRGLWAKCAPCATDPLDTVLDEKVTSAPEQGYAAQFSPTTFPLASENPSLSQGSGEGTMR